MEAFGTYPPRSKKDKSWPNLAFDIWKRARQTEGVSSAKRAEQAAVERAVSKTWAEAFVTARSDSGPEGYRRARHEYLRLGSAPFADIAALGSAEPVRPPPRGINT